MYEEEVYILSFLDRRGFYGSSYTKAIRFKRIPELKRLIKKGFIIIHKKGRTISLNPHKKNEIINYIQEYFLKKS